MKNLFSLSNAQVDWNLRWANTSEDTFSDVRAALSYIVEDAMSFHSPLKRQAKQKTTIVYLFTAFQRKQA